MGAGPPARSSIGHSHGGDLLKGSESSSREARTAVIETPEGPTSGKGPRADDEALRRWLQGSLLGRPDPAPQILAIQRRPVAGAPSLPCEAATTTPQGAAATR